jgi:UPF0755 protein
MSDLGLFQEPNRGDGHLSGERLGRRAQRSARKRDRRKRAGSRAAVLFSLAFLVAVFGVGGVLGFAWLDDRLHPPDYSGVGYGSTVLQVKSGEYAAQYALRMQDDKIVKSARAFVKAAKNEPRISTVQPGYYTLRMHMSAKSALALLLDPKSRENSTLSVPEGLRSYETIKLLSQKTGISVTQFDQALKNPAALGLPASAKGNVEGYLYPARYDLNPQATAADLLKMMVDRFKSENTGLATQAKKAKMTVTQVVTMASLIQAEAGTPADEPKIARVLLNRIQQVNGPAKGRLQLDTTVLYALHKRTLRVYNKDLQVNSPYNTYVVKGLPVGPIDSPGETAINAALHPAQGNWYWFVTTDPDHKITKFTDKDSQFAEFKQELDNYLKSKGQ